MQIDQKKFLGHINHNGNTVSMRDFQQHQQSLWSNTFTAAVKAGKDAYTSTILADAAVTAFNTRFNPQHEQ